MLAFYLISIIGFFSYHLFVQFIIEKLMLKLFVKIKKTIYN